MLRRAAKPPGVTLNTLFLARPAVVRVRQRVWSPSATSWRRRTTAANLGACGRLRRLPGAGAQLQQLGVLRRACGRLRAPAHKCANAFARAYSSLHASRYMPGSCSRTRSRWRGTRVERGFVA